MKTACLLLHGFCGTPFEVAPLVPALTARGVHVDTPALPGHAASIEEMKKTFFPDWLAFTVDRYKLLAQAYERVIVGGFSMGGVLAALLAAQFPCAGLFTLAMPMHIYRLCPWEVPDWRIPLMGVLQYIMPYPTFHRAKSASRALAPFEGYEGVFFMPQLYSVVKGTALMRQSLHAITCPTFIMHDMRDRLSAPSSALLLAQAIRAKDIAIEYTSINERVTSHHLITTHCQTRDLVAQRVGDFVARISGAEAVPE